MQGIFRLSRRWPCPGHPHAVALGDAGLSEDTAGAEDRRAAWLAEGGRENVARPPAGGRGQRATRDSAPLLGGHLLGGPGEGQGERQEHFLRESCSKVGSCQLLMPHRCLGAVRGRLHRPGAGTAGVTEMAEL